MQYTSLFNEKFLRRWPRAGHGTQAREARGLDHFKIISTWGLRLPWGSPALLNSDKLPRLHAALTLHPTTHWRFGKGGLLEQRPSSHMEAHSCSHAPSAWKTEPSLPPATSSAGFQHGDRRHEELIFRTGSPWGAGWGIGWAALNPLITKLPPFRSEHYTREALSTVAFYRKAQRGHTLVLNQESWRGNSKSEPASETAATAASHPPSAVSAPTSAHFPAPPAPRPPLGWPPASPGTRGRAGPVSAGSRTWRCLSMFAATRHPPLPTSEGPAGLGAAPEGRAGLGRPGPAPRTAGTASCCPQGRPALLSARGLLRLLLPPPFFPSPSSLFSLPLFFSPNPPLFFPLLLSLPPSCSPPPALGRAWGTRPRGGPLPSPGSWKLWSLSPGRSALLCPGASESTSANWASDARQAG